MLVHSVYFWLREDLDDSAVEAFSQDVATLLDISTVRHGWIGRPASTRRPVIDHSYSFALTVVFDDLAGHDAYQIDPLHLTFLERQRTAWSRVVIYDSH